MSVSFTNQKASQAYQGESVIVFLNQSDTLKLPTIAVGQLCTVGSSSAIGYISDVDLYGTSFKVKPQYPSSSFQSDVIGYLKANETVTVTT